MPQIAERACIALLAVYLIWLPLPFGSIIDAAFVPLILPPILICALAACLRSRMPPNTSLHMSLAYRIWTAGAVALVIIVALQLVPLPQSLLAPASPMSQRIWSSADRVASLAHIAADSSHNHGTFVKNAQVLLNELKKNGTITAAQKDALSNCVGQSNNP